MRKLTDAGAQSEDNGAKIHNASNQTPQFKNTKLNYIGQFVRGDHSVGNKNTCTRIVRYCGIALFALGVATLYSMLYLYKDTGTFPYYCILIAACEILAGFSGIKFAYSQKYSVTLIIITCACGGVLTVTAAIITAILQWPLYLAFGALITSLACLLINKLKTKHK